MTAEPQPARLSPLDTHRWKAVTAKASGISRHNLPAALAFCRRQGVAFLIARCPTTDLAAAQAMEREGFELMDTLVYFSRDIASGAPEDPGSVPIRELRAGEDGAVREVAARSFVDYPGHYHADPRLDRRQCDEAYADWAHRCCLSKDVADTVLVGPADGKIVGFITVQLGSAEEAEVALFAVAPQAQRRGIGRSLMIGALRWARAQGAKRMAISTQITNLGSQKLWARLGFELSRSYYTFHKWF